MTELEKAKKGMFNDVDLNKLMKEIRQENVNYMEMCAKAACSSHDTFRKIGIETHMQRAADIQVAINAMLMKLGLSEPLLAFYAAALSAMSDIVLGISEDPETNRAGAKSIEKYLNQCTTAAYTKIQCTFEGEKQP